MSKSRETVTNDQRREVLSILNAADGAWLDGSAILSRMKDRGAYRLQEVLDDLASDKQRLVHVSGTRRVPEYTITRKGVEQLKKLDAIAQVDLGAAIVSIDEQMQRLLSCGLTKTAIVVLLKESTGMPKTQIELVLNSLTELRKTYTTL